MLLTLSGSLESLSVAVMWVKAGLVKVSLMWIALRLVLPLPVRTAGKPRG